MGQFLNTSQRWDADPLVATATVRTSLTSSPATAVVSPSPSSGSTISAGRRLAWMSSPSLPTFSRGSTSRSPRRLLRLPVSRATSTSLRWLVSTPSTFSVSTRCCRAPVLTDFRLVCVVPSVSPLVASLAQDRSDPLLCPFQGQLQGPRHRGPPPRQVQVPRQAKDRPLQQVGFHPPPEGGVPAAQERGQDRFRRCQRQGGQEQGCPRLLSQPCKYTPYAYEKK